jgi:hypothetical protein
LLEEYRSCTGTYSYEKVYHKYTEAVFKIDNAVKTEREKEVAMKRYNAERKRQ